jgi:sRNA-binding protein
MSFLGSLFGGGADKKAKNAAADAAAAQAKLEAERKAQLDKEKLDEENNTTRDAAKNRQKQAAVGATGGRDTILTGPLGDTSTPQEKTKTLLGM